MFLVGGSARSIGRGVFHADQNGVLEVTQAANYNDACEHTSSSTSTSLLSTPSTSFAGDEDVEDDVLGFEHSQLKPEQEKRGVWEVLQALSQVEKSQVPDKYMYIRHLRAEKVCIDR
jgi:hypothetical protein